jgi:Skp family chaperone for outer membrane proteins
MNHRSTITLLTTLIASAVPATAGAHSAEAVPFKIGYFDKQALRGKFPIPDRCEKLLPEAERMIRSYEAQGQALLQTAKERGDSEEKTSEVKRQINREIGEKRAALEVMYESHHDRLVTFVVRAAKVVAEKNGLDVVIDIQGIIAGETLVRTDGEDLTQAMIDEYAAQMQALHLRK